MALSLNVSAAFGGIGRALGNAGYRRYWTANTINTIGRWMYRVAVGWLAWELTESSMWLGIVAFADTFPMVIFSILAGAVADRIGYLRVIRVSQCATATVAILFAGLTLMGWITIELVVLLAALLGSMEALSTPARMSLVHSLVPKKDLSPAIALGSATFNGARLIGPAIAGPLLIPLGSGGVIALAALTFFQFFVVLLFLRANEPERTPSAAQNLLQDINRAILYVFREPGVRFLMITLGVTGILIRPCIDLLPGFASLVFDRGPEGFAALMSSIGFGAMISGLWLAQRGRTAGLTHLVTFSLMIQGVALVAFTVVGHLWLAAFCLATLGFFMLAAGVASQTLIQNTVDSAMRARVMSLFVVISWGLPALGALVMGRIADHVGLQITIGTGAALAVFVWLWARTVQGALADGLERAD